MKASVVAGLSVALAASAAAAQPKAGPPALKGPAGPHLVTGADGARLVVAGRPFLMLGGELGNSSAADAAWARPLLAKLPALGLNTVLVPVSWELVEPAEGKLDFRLVDDLLREARRNHLRAVLLWFGSWKNGMSSYVPAWVKRDQQRFPRAARADGTGVETLSAFSDANRDADARTFAALMRHLRAFDGREQTVIMVQVENEVALIDEDSADRSPAAAAAFNGPVPPALLDALGARGETADTALARAWRANGRRRAGSWPAVFGKGPATDELFMAWHFARYVDAVARAGKAEYPLPMYVNAALNRPGLAPGKYPTGGPLPHLLDVWKAGAPAIDLFSPDIYFPDFAAWFERYRRADNPLFVPEARNGDEAAANAFYAIGQRAIGFSPFAIETTPPATAAALAKTYALLAQLAPVLLGGAPSAGVLLEKEAPTARLALGGHTLTVAHDYTFPWAAPARNDPTWPRAGGLVIALGDGEYLVAGSGIIVTFAPAAPGGIAGIERVDEGRYEGGRFVVTRRLNGDETHQGRQVRIPMGEYGLQRVKLYRYR
jgi:beta-galactosidase GanA